MSPLKQSTNIAARMGRWSATPPEDRDLRLARVRRRLVRDRQRGRHADDRPERHRTSARPARADHIIRDAGFKLDEQMEYVLVQSPTKTAADPAFRAVVDETIAKLETLPAGDEAPLAARAGQRGPDLGGRPRGADPVQRRRARYDEADDVHRHDHGRHRAGAEGEPRLLRRRGGLGLDGQGARRDVRLAARAGRADLDPDHARASCCSCSARSSARRSRSLLALTAVFATMGLVALPSQIVPMDEAISEVILLIGLAVGVDYSLFYIRRERDERRAGRSESAALEAAAATSGRAVLISGHHGDDRDGRDVLLRRQDVHVVRDRDDDGRRRRDDRLAHRPAGDALVARRPGRQGAGSARSAGSSGTTARAGSGAAILDRVLRRPLVSAVGATAVLVALALPALQPAHERVGPRRPAQVAGGGAVATTRCRTRSRAARPPRSSRSRATPPIPALQAAVADLKRQALASGKALEPIDVETSPSGTVAPRRDPARREAARTPPRTTRSRRSATRSCRPRSARSRASSTR